MKTILKIFLPLFALMVIFSYKNDPETPLSVLTKVKEKYESHQSISYDINYIQKFFDYDDSVKIDAKCTLVRDKKDTVLNGYVWLNSLTDTTELIYDTKNTYLVYNNEKKIIEDSDVGFITGNVNGDVMEINFLNEKSLLNYFKDTTKNITMIEDVSHYTIIIDYDNAQTEPYSEMQTKLRVRKKDYVIDKINFKAKFQEKYQYNQWLLSNIEFDKTSKVEINAYLDERKKSYILEVFKPRNEEDYKLIDNGTEAPNFTGENFSTKSEVSLSDYRGKLVLLDFYYMACFPCIKAIPYLSKFQEKYKNDLIVLGINSTDIDEKDKNKLPTFFEKNTMNYSTILTTRKTDSLYNVLAYPTLYLLDREGKVIYSEIGFDEKLMDSLDVVISKNIK